MELQGMLDSTISMTVVRLTTRWNLMRNELCIVEVETSLRLKVAAIANTITLNPGATTSVPVVVLNTAATNIDVSAAVPDADIVCANATSSAAVPSIRNATIACPTTSSSAPVASSKLKTKKPTIMKPSKSSTPRNLCAIQWCAKNPGGLLTEFATYWISIQDTSDAEPFKHASREAETAKKTACLPGRTEIIPTNDLRTSKSFQDAWK
ncbi:hypothetical protein EV361DRAFT_1033778 [Lentinula raphanica]|nr:hypothetical protein EV361DRAFT_1033778 [Lentinula raphanica]